MVKGYTEMSKVVDEPDLRNRNKVFDSRFHAGEILSQKLTQYANRNDTFVLAIPAGGVQVATVVAKNLNLPLDLAITRKIHVPWNKEAGFGAISWNGLVILTEPLVASLGLTDEDISRCVAKEKEIIKRRVERFRGNRPFPNLKNKNVIIIDDGLASGFSMLTTVNAVRRNKTKELIVAVPTAPIGAIDLLRPQVDKIICLNIRSGAFFAVADAYKNWYDLNDKDVIEILKSKNQNNTRNHKSCQPKST
jgi:putative phosphoribosyl transferase